MADTQDRFEEMEHGGGGFMTGLLAGCVLGAGLGMLLAPKAGADLRGQIGTQARNLGTKATEQYRRATERASDWAERGRHMVDRARETVTRGTEGTQGYTTGTTYGRPTETPTSDFGRS